MLKKMRHGVIAFALATIVSAVLRLFGAPSFVIRPIAGCILLIVWVYLENNRSTRKVTAADRDRMLADAPPAGYGLIYIHRGFKVGGFAVGFDVDLDNRPAAQLKVGQFTRLVVAPGAHLLKVGPKKALGQMARPNKAEMNVVLGAGETAVYEMSIGKGTTMRDLVVITLARQPDARAGLAKLASVTMVAPEKTSVAEPIPVAAAAA